MSITNFAEITRSLSEYTVSAHDSSSDFSTRLSTSGPERGGKITLKGRDVQSSEKTVSSHVPY
jgi:hypothetical protein